MKKTSVKVGEFGPIYTQFKNKPKEAIAFLKQKQNGECVKALFREETGFVDIVWGKNNPKTNVGYGLKHIIEKHGDQIRRLGFGEVDDFIPFAFKFGTPNYEKLKNKFKIILESDTYRVVLLTEWKGKKKTLLLTSYSFRKKALRKKKALPNELIDWL